MEYESSFVSGDNPYEDVPRAEVARNVAEMSSSHPSISYHGRTRSARTKRDSMSSVDSNYSDKAFEEKSLDDELNDAQTVRKTGKKRGRKPTQLNLEAKLERSRQSARECRARKKLRYQSLEDTIAQKEAKVYALRNEVKKVLPN